MFNEWGPDLFIPDADAVIGCPNPLTFRLQRQKAFIILDHEEVKIRTRNNSCPELSAPDKSPDSCWFYIPVVIEFPHCIPRVLVLKRNNGNDLLSSRIATGNAADSIFVIPALFARNRGVANAAIVFKVIKVKTFGMILQFKLSTSLLHANILKNPDKSNKIIEGFRRLIPRIFFAVFSFE